MLSRYQKLLNCFIFHMNFSEREPPSPQQGRTLLVWSLLGVFLLIGVVARFWNVADLPLFIHNDESAIAVFRTPFHGPYAESPFWGGKNYGGHGNFGAWLAHLSLEAFGGQTLWALRMGSVVCGVVSVVLFGLFVRSWLGVRASLFFVAAVVPFHFHIHFSRTGFHYIQAVTFIALVTFLFGRFLRSPLLINGLLLGIGLGLSQMVYSATRVLPGVVAVGFLAAILSPTYRKEMRGGSVARIALLAVSIAIGTLISYGPQLWYVLHATVESRLASQNIFQESYRAVLARDANGATDVLSIFWVSLLRTMRFFTQMDGSNQYGLSGPPLEFFSFSAAGVGLAFIVYRALRLDPRALYVLALGCSTVVGSAVMLEANFSPHLIAFALLLPLACALGLECLFRLTRQRSPWLAGLVAIVLFVPWASWNYNLYRTHERKKRNLDAYILHLPIDRQSVRTMINYSPFIADFGESFYTLQYPQSKRERRQGISDLSRDMVELYDSHVCPCVFVVSNEDFPVIRDGLISNGKKYQEYRFEGSPGTVLYLE